MIDQICGIDLNEPIEKVPTHVLMKTYVLLQRRVKYCLASTDGERVSFDGMGRDDWAGLVQGIEKEVAAAEMLLAKSEIDKAQAMLEPYRSLGIGLFDYQSAGPILAEIRRVQMQSHISGKYTATSLTPDVAALEIRYR